MHTLLFYSFWIENLLTHYDNNLQKVLIINFRIDAACKNQRIIAFFRHSYLSCSFVPCHCQSPTESAHIKVLVNLGMIQTDIAR